VVQILSAGPQDDRIAFGGGVVDNDRVQGCLPPDPEWLVC
jgi:hypothetical protein